jgi:hypothetical protein
MGRQEHSDRSGLPNRSVSATQPIGHPDPMDRSTRPHATRVREEAALTWISRRARRSCYSGHLDFLHRSLRFAAGLARPHASVTVTAGLGHSDPWRKSA